MTFAAVRRPLEGLRFPFRTVDEQVAQLGPTGGREVVERRRAVVLLDDVRVRSGVDQ